MRIVSSFRKNTKKGNADKSINEAKSEYINNLNCNDYIKKVVRVTPAFNFYQVTGSVVKMRIMAATKRPANLFYDQLQLEYTKPGESLFCFKNSLTKNLKKFEDSDGLIIKAGKEKCLVHQKPYSLRKLFGAGEYHISIAEVKEIVKSQKIYLTNLLPQQFYIGLKKAMIADGIVTLPGNDRSLFYLKEFLSTKIALNCKKYVKEVFEKPASYGFGKEYEKMFSFELFKNLSLYQIGSMLVKTERYHIFINDNYQIANRSIDDKDDILLINSCGIRGFHSSTDVTGNTVHEIDQKILTHMYRAAMTTVGKGGFYILPALGMGVWGGLPEIYWEAFLSAVVSISLELGNIFVSPAHQERRGFRGQEFDTFLKKKLLDFPSNNNLRKVINLYELKTDVVLFAKHLKAEFPERTVGLQNASDPDVTLGDHVGEYVNNLNHSSTTEEHCTAIGTNGINFERFTGVLDDPDRIISLQT